MLVFPCKNILLISHDACFGASWTSLLVMENSSLKKSISPMPRCNERKTFQCFIKIQAQDLIDYEKSVAKHLNLVRHYLFGCATSEKLFEKVSPASIY